MRIRRIKNLVFSLVISGAIVIGLFAVPSVGAQASSANAAQGIEISPALVELNAERGKTYTLKIKVTNVTSSDLVYETSIDDFNAKDETGSPQILMYSELPSTVSIRSWVKTVPAFSLTTRQSISIVATVHIPADAEPGGHYGVLRFSGHAPELDSTGVGLAASAGALILIRVDGAITEQADLVSFTTASNGSQTSFFENSPITFMTRIKNVGNIHVKPVGNIEVKDMFGNIVTSLSVNADKSNVLPDSIRRFEATHDGWMFGLYTANLALGYGTTGQAITATTSFWVIPYKLVLAVLIIGATTVFILVKLIKAYNKRIIAKSKNETTHKTKKHNKKGK